MKIGNIYINGAIGVFQDESGQIVKGVELVDVIAQVAMQPKAQAYRVHISSEGGLVDEGFDIFEYLMTLNKPIHTIGEGMVASIATVIFMAGSTRTLKANCRFMIHLPSGGVEGDSQDIKEYSDSMQKTEKDIIKFYSKHTKLKETSLFPLLKNETWLDPKKAFELGFSTEEPTERKAVAHFNPKTINKMKNKKNKSKKDVGGFSKKDKNVILEGFKALGKMFGTPAKNLIVQDADGNDVDFPEVEAMEDIAVGDAATVEGADADGDYVFPDGKTYTFKEGKLESISDDEGDDDLEDMKAKLDAALLENKELKTSNKAAQKEFKALKKKVTASFSFSGTKTEKKNKKKKAKGKKKKSETAASKMAANAEKLAERRRQRNQPSK